MEEMYKYINYEVITEYQKFVEEGLEKYREVNPNGIKTIKDYMLNMVSIVVTHEIVHNKQEENIIKSIIIAYVSYFCSDYDLDDIIKTIKSRSHYYRDCELSINELSYDLINSLHKKEFSAQLLLKFAYKGLN